MSWYVLDCGNAMSVWRFRSWLHSSILVLFNEQTTSSYGYPNRVLFLNDFDGRPFPSQFVCNAVKLYVLMSWHPDKCYFAVLGHLVKRSTTLRYCFRVITNPTLLKLLGYLRILCASSLLLVWKLFPLDTHYYGLVVVSYRMNIRY